MRRYMPLLLLVSLYGCGTVHTTTPLGSAPFALDPEAWNGRWCSPAVLTSVATTAGESESPDHCLTLTVVDPAAGVMDVVLPEDPPEYARVHLGRVPGDDESALASTEGKGDYELVGRIRREGPLVLWWDARASAFCDEVDGGRLPGHTEKGDVWLEPLDEAAVARIARDEHSVLFDWQSPEVLVRAR